MAQMIQFKYQADAPEQKPQIDPRPRGTLLAFPAAPAKKAVARTSPLARMARLLGDVPLLRQLSTF